MTHRRRLEALKGAIGPQPDDSDVCLECRGSNAYGRRLDYARLRVGAQGKLFGVDPEQCRAKLQELTTYPDSERCPKCGGLNDRGEHRRDAGNGGRSEQGAAAGKARGDGAIHG